MIKIANVLFSGFMDFKESEAWNIGYFIRPYASQRISPSYDTYWCRNLVINTQLEPKSIDPSKGNLESIFDEFFHIDINFYIGQD